ncbi:RNA helicase [Clostridium swellfunianum]|uniref:helicase-related protein n=1 Tax=Clostridium swellfunianum TaxID=1367462 RepID=UPI00202E4F07|nr:helicase-related protein [Clostridium swellfunianum]MCM0648547.1 RNA helicase [Clostridium swellfunianum]
MKKGAAERNFRKLKNQVKQINEIVHHSKIHALWEHEAAVRKKIKELKEYEKAGLKDFDEVLSNYIDILEYVSVRLIEDYNNRNKTDFYFDDIISNHYESFIKSGIMSVLITNHIPDILSREFDKVFPDNPKNEYADARRYERKIYLHLGETNTGKTYNAVQRLKEAGNGVYLSPLRILALENFERLNREGTRCNLVTGEEEIRVDEAKHTACTIEKLNINEEYEVGIIDEIQMIDDDQRGAAWTRALLGLKCKEIHVCGAINAKELLMKILDDTGEEYEIREYRREVPLEIIDKSFSYKDIEQGDALVVFSKKRVLELAYYYSEMGIKASLIYGDLPPEVRRKQYDQFINKETTILITTDAIGMGVNLPIKRIIFMDVRKFDGSEVRYLHSQEVKQIAGRAGRKGIYDVGYVAGYGGTQEFLRENLEMEDYQIEQAVLGPSEEILRVHGLPLREKLALWSTRREKLPYYRKMDISEYLIILDTIKGYKLDQKTHWRLLKIPFDISNQELMNTFLSFIDQVFVAKGRFISKPQLLKRELNDLETQYQQINLYYSFSRAFNLEFDEQWVYSTRIKISEGINEILKGI